MSVITAHPRLRWLAPLLVVVVALGGTALLGGRADARVDLEPRSAAQLLVDVQTALADGAPGMSGTVVQTANLGLPELPLPGGQGASELGSTLSGTHTWRVWYAGPDKARLALVGTLGESDVIRNGRDVWLWSSQDKTATHYTLPDDTDGKAGATPLPSPAADPAEAARQALAALDPTTEVSAPGATTVAGRDAYQLVLTPRSTTTLVDRVTIAVDAEELVPLRVQVYSTKLTDPAVEVGFTSIDFSTPDDRQFAFTPPPGTTVTEGDLPEGSDRPTHGASGFPKDDDGTDGEHSRVVGTGWDAVMVADLPDPDRSSGAGGEALTDLPDQLQGVLSQLPVTSGDWGSGRVLEGTLFTVVLTDDGRVAAGAVGPQAVQAALAS